MVKNIIATDKNNLNTLYSVQEIRAQKLNNWKGWNCNALQYVLSIDEKGDVRSIPQLSKSSAHTIVASDAGKHSINSSGGWVINTSTGFTAGQAITLINNSSGDQTITSTGVTLYNSADGSTPTKIATRGMATVICTASNTYYISGAGLS